MAHIRAKHPDAGITADPEAANIGSCRALEKNGFQLVRRGQVASEPTDAPMAIYRRRPGER